MHLERESPLQQMQLAALLRYFQYGSFSVFRRAAELAFGAEARDSPFFSPNLLMAAQVGGLCEVGSQQGLIKWWWSGSPGDIEICGWKPKAIALTPSGFKPNQAPLLPLITDSAGPTLLWGKQVTTSEETASTSLFRRRLDQLLPTFKKVEAKVCEPISPLSDFKGAAQAYCPETGSWDADATDMQRGIQLLRVQREYSGVSYYIQHAPLGLRVRVREVSWAFLAAHLLLRWPLASLCQIENGSVRFRRAIRLPPIISRLLFASADSMRIGEWVVYEHVHPRAIDGLVAYLQ